MLETYYNCPISEDPVHEVLLRHGGFVEFSCPRCGRFRISNSAIKSMKNLYRVEREALLNEARRNAQGGDGVPIIRDTH